MVRINFDHNHIAEFCRKRHIKELSLFGSVLRDDFRSDSDVDVLVVFGDDADKDLRTYLETEEELRAIFGRDVDLVEKSAVRNPFRRHHILNNREVVYES
ncbi:MAG: nucleotidyltransferase domain-containing protein [Planctomycetota bacterium]